MPTKRLHYYSGLFLTIFIALHLLNHLLSMGGVDTHIHAMKILRMGYRNPLVEALLLLAVGIQIVSGGKLFFQKRPHAVHFFEKLHIGSGAYLALFLLIHLSAVMAGRWMLHLDTNFYFGVAGLNYFPTLLFFVPYYGLAILAFGGHIASIHYQKMQQNIGSFTPYQQSMGILIVTILLTICIFYGLTNALTGVTIPQEYDVLIGK